jgi:hypothetical protein
MWPVHNSGVCCHASLLCLGEDYWHPYFKKHVASCCLSDASDSASLVLCHSIPILWTYQFNSRCLACHFHSLHHSLHCSHACFLHCQGTPECSSEAAFLHAKLDCNLPCQHFHCHLDSGNWHRMGWLGKCYHFQGSNQNFWCVCTMLSMPTNSSTSTSTQPKHHPP